MARAALLALLVACAFVGTATVGATALQSSTSEQFEEDRLPDVELLGLDGQTRSDVTVQGVDVSTAVAAQRGAARASVDRRALEIAFERAENEQARRELLFEAATDVEIAISALRSRQRNLRADYVNGTITTGTYARSRALGAARAEEFRTDIQLIQRYVDRVPQLSMRSRLEALRVALTGVDGPVTDSVGAAIAGEVPAAHTFVAVSTNGRVMSTRSNGEYVREAYRSDVWTPDTTSGIGFALAVERLAELYPVAFNSSRNLGTGMSEHGAGTYRVSMEIREGEIVTYLDGDAQNVFYEVRRLRLASIQPGPAVSETENGTRLAVNRTYDGGPLRIEVADNTTGTPADVPVLVDGTRYQPGSDGVVWALAPEGSAEVVALGPTGNVSVSVVPVRPNYVNVSPVESTARMRTPAPDATEP